MIDLGTVRPGSTVYIPWATFAGASGASITSTGLAVTDVEVYKDGSMTQRASDSGYTLLDTDGIDLDGVTGIQGISISLADNTTAGFWSAGSRYFVVIASVTIDSQTVNFVPVTFDIGYPDAVINTTIATLASQTSFTLTLGPAEDDALNGCVVCIHDVASAVQLGFAVILDYTGSTKTVTLTAGVTFTAAATDNVSIYPPTASRWSAATLEVATGTHLTAVPWNAAWDAEVESEVDDALGGGTGTALTAIPWNASWDTEVESEATDALNAYDPPTRAEATTDVNSVLAVLGALADAAADGAVTSTDTAIAYLKQIVNTLEGAPGIPTYPAAAAPGNAVSIAEAVRGIYERLGAPAGASTAADIAAVKVDTAAILVDTDVIGAAGAGLTSLATQVSVNTIDDFLDTEIAAIIALLAGVVPVSGTIGATGNDTTHLHLTGLAYADDGINTYLLTFLDVSAGLYYLRWIEDFANTGDLATVAALPVTPEASVDKYWITAMRSDVTGGSGLDAAGVRTAVGLASANLDTQLTTIDDFLDTEVSAIKTVTDQLVAVTTEPSGVPSATATPLQQISRLYAALRNKLTVTATKKIFYNDAETAVWEKDLTDDGTTYTESESNAP